MKLKENLHSLIDQIENDDLLEMVYQILDTQKDNKSGQLLDQLSEREREELYASYEDSLDKANLVDLDDVKKKQQLKWKDKLS